MPRFETLHGFLLHARPIGERTSLATLLTKEHSRLQVFFKGPLPELGRQFEVKIKRSKDQVNAGDFRYTDPVLVQTHAAKYFLLYINELTFKLAQIETESEVFYLAYMQTLLSINYSDRVQKALREFEWSLLQDVGQAIDFSRDQDFIPVEPDASYDFSPSAGFVRVQAGRYHGRQVLAAGQLDPTVPGAMSTARECLFSQIHALLDGQPLESREWLKEISTR